MRRHWFMCEKSPNWKQGHDAWQKFIVLHDESLSFRSSVFKNFKLFFKRVFLSFWPVSILKLEIESEKWLFYLLTGKLGNYHKITLFSPFLTLKPTFLHGILSYSVILEDVPKWRFESRGVFPKKVFKVRNSCHVAAKVGQKRKMFSKGGMARYVI